MFQKVTMILPASLRKKSSLKYVIKYVHDNSNLCLNIIFNKKWSTFICLGVKRCDFISTLHFPTCYLYNILQHLTVFNTSCLPKSTYSIKESFLTRCSLLFKVALNWHEDEKKFNRNKQFAVKATWIDKLNR